MTERLQKVMQRIQRAQEELSLAQEKYDRYIQNPEQFPELSKEQLESDVTEKILHTRKP